MVIGPRTHYDGIEGDECISLGPIRFRIRGYVIDEEACTKKHDNLEHIYDHGQFCIRLLGDRVHAPKSMDRGLSKIQASNTRKGIQNIAN
jgi:hypothetical protein